MRKHNFITIGLENLLKQKVRTVVMILFTFILSASLFLSSIVLKSMQANVDRTVNRMGADIVVVPEEYSDEYKDALFQGGLCNFNFDKMWYEKIVQIKGITQATPQLYIASLAAACCDAQVQLVAFDQETDFIVQPWLNKMHIDELKPFEVVVGDDVSGFEGDKITFFNKDFTIAGRLENTGTTYDTCVFINYETAYEILQTEQLKNLTLGNHDPESVISSIMIRVEENIKPSDVARNINFRIEGCPAKAYAISEMTNSISNSIEEFSIFSRILNYLLFFLAVLAVICIFVITIQQRRSEFGVLITLGATKARLIGIILVEGLTIGLIGGALGTICSGGVLYLFKDVVMLRLGITAFVMDVFYYFKIGMSAVTVSTFTGVMASVCAIIMISRKEPLELIQEGNV